MLRSYDNGLDLMRFCTVYVWFWEKELESWIPVAPSVSDTLFITSLTKIFRTKQMRCRLSILDLTINESHLFDYAIHLACFRRIPPLQLCLSFFAPFFLALAPSTSTGASRIHFAIASALSVPMRYSSSFATGPLFFPHPIGSAALA